MARNRTEQAGQRAVPEGSNAVAGRLFCALGRGDKGKSWLLRIIIEMALVSGRAIRVADADPGNRTLADAMLRSGRVQPLQPADTSDTARANFVRDMISVAERGESVVLDVGGNDQTVAAVAGQRAGDREMEEFSALWGVTEHISSFSGVETTLAYLLGGDPHDLALLGRLRESALTGVNILLVRNEGVLRAQGAAGDDPWAATAASPIYRAAVADGARVMTLPAIPPSIPIRLAETGEAFSDALRGTGSLSHWERQALQSLLVGVGAKIKKLEIESWFP